MTDFAHCGNNQFDLIPPFEFHESEDDERATSDPFYNNNQIKKTLTAYAVSGGRPVSARAHQTPPGTVGSDHDRS
jgi:hypothetical protein